MFQRIFKKQVALRCGVATALAFGLTAVLACAPVSSQSNPFLTYAEAFGFGTGSDTGGAGSGQVFGAEDVFRRDLTLTLINSSSSILETSFAAWIGVQSIRTAEQQDALLRSGYVQLSRELQLGTAFTLPVGTFVFNGPGTAGATNVRIEPGAIPTGQEGDDEGAPPVQNSFTMVTPDVILIFNQPPVSCDSVAFTFADPLTGEVIAGAATGGGGYKTLAQVDVYSCDPFEPGLFFNSDGGQPEPNEFDEGNTVSIVFTRGVTAAGASAQVIIGAGAVQFEDDEETP